MNNYIDQIRELIKSSNTITVLSGAGMSTESGISDFRSPGGVWTKYKTVTIQEFVRDPEKRKYYWRYKAETIPSMLKAKPNNGHKALGTLYKQQKLLWLLTQNIDGLHQQGGVGAEKIVRLHGTNREAICLSCKDIQPIEDVLQRIEHGEEDPLCKKCNGLLKPNTVSFGQSLNPEHLAIAESATSECDLFMALGSSLQVYPACRYVELAYHYKKPIIIINRDATPYDDMATYTLSDPLAQVLPRLIH